MEGWSFFFSNCLLVLVIIQSATIATGKTCPSCGSTPVPFPLSTDGKCGDHSYKIRCCGNTSRLFLDGINNSYPITSIDSSNMLLTVNTSFIERESCISSDLNSMGFQLNDSLPFSVTANNTIMLFNCTPQVLLAPINCSSNSPCYRVPHKWCQSLPLCCTYGAGGSSTSHSIRGLGMGNCAAYRSFINLDLTQPVDTWFSKSGVELRWAPPREPICETQEDCEEGAKANCTVDSSSVGGSETVKRCFCVRPLVWNPIIGMCEHTGCKGGIGCKQPLIAGLASGLAAALVLCTIGFILYVRQRRLRLARERLVKEREQILNLKNMTGRTAKNFTSREMKQATNTFSRDNLLGAGGFGEVYKGMLPDGTPIAVKCAKIGNTKSTDQVLNEVRILSQVNHRSLVRLLGCCVDLAQPLMVYEFIPNGTLSDHLHGIQSRLTWHHRLSIAHQTAEGLAYLHFSAVPPIYHRDVKSTNILLDENLNAKVSDFGLSRLAESDLSHISTCAQGTLGYLDPEYYRNFQLTDKSDVYSFGVVLLELITSQKAIDFTRPSDDVNLTIYMQQLVMQDRIMEAVDPMITKGVTDIELDSIKALGFLAMSCLEEKRQDRPSMKEVAEEIEYIINLLAVDIDESI
ncbi:hypothetical protein LUZ61_014794 [Rhynchospora tenuis]|uniref:Protein kinase domain-containing protein n=1 Tax=Rhynchospora tenuis TaxID=198213 RepID=A0AAD5WBD5_9POAL|nr:hypothetical protein LUZ61_014794 [Rhynchospora tenuis]